MRGQQGTYMTSAFTKGQIAGDPEYPAYMQPQNDSMGPFLPPFPSANYSLWYNATKSQSLSLKTCHHNAEKEEVSKFVQLGTFCNKMKE